MKLAKVSKSYEHVNVRRTVALYTFSISDIMVIIIGTVFASLLLRNHKCQINMKYSISICLLISFVVSLSSCDGSSSSTNNTYGYHQGMGKAGRRTWASEHMTPPAQRQEQTYNYTPTQTTSPTQVYTPPTENIGGGNILYAELWDECEYLEGLLEDYDIEHESMTYPMDYYELRDLRDEYVDLLEEYEIDY